MHHALFLEEILHVIFGHCYDQHRFLFRFEQGCTATDLISLASACRVFKEPALDLLWSELRDPTPLARCLPGICCVQSSEFGRTTYMFSRKLEDAERDTVRRYTRRVRFLSIMDDACSLDFDSLADLCMLSTTDTLFPNIRQLCYRVMDWTLPLIHHVAAPNLRSLRLDFTVSNISSCQSLVHSLGSNCPNVKTIELKLPGGQSLIGFNETVARHIRCWTHLQTVNLPEVSLDIDALSHLSCMPSLTRLSFTLSPALTPQTTSSNCVLVFSKLQSLEINIRSFAPSELLTHMRLPTATRIEAVFHGSSPSRHTVRTFLVALQTVRTCKLPLTLFVHQPVRPSLDIQDSERPVLTLEDIHYFTALNLTAIHINLNWAINLKDSDILELAINCHQLTLLVINNAHGWGSPGGITPTGLLQLLQRCPSLRYLCIALDTRGYTLLPQAPTSDENPVPHLAGVDVADSIIEAESVPALAAFFGSTFPQLVSHCRLTMRSWASSGMCRHNQDWEIYSKRWQEVFRLARQHALKQSRESESVIEN